MAKEIEIKDLGYEEAFAELEEMVKALESEEHTLEEAMKLFERGQALSKHCAELLEKTELRLSQLTAEGDLTEFEE